MAALFVHRPVRSAVRSTVRMTGPCTKGPPPYQLVAVARRDPRRCCHVAIVWPCPLTVDAYAATGRRWRCRGRSARRAAGRWCSGLVTGGMSARRRREPEDLRPAGAVRPCAVTHALLPAFVSAGGWMRPRRSARYRRGRAAARAGSARPRPRRGCRIRPRGAGSAGSPRGPGSWRWLLGAGGGAGRGGPRRAGIGRFASAAIGAAFAAAAGLPGWAGLGAWRFACAVTGGRLLAANTTRPV